MHPTWLLVCEGCSNKVAQTEWLQQKLLEGDGTPLQHSCLENPMDGGAWQATVHAVAKSWTGLSDLAAAAAAEISPNIIPEQF